MQSEQRVRTRQAVSYSLADDGSIPNNRELPLVVYQEAIVLPQGDPASAIEKVFQANQWTGGWRNGVYPYHHYHSTAHEVLGVYSGTATIQFGGEKGVTLSVKPGDVIIIPAGVGHKNLECSRDFRVVGAYPVGQHVDMNYGKSGERPQADENIGDVPLPQSDPVYGAEGILTDYWGND